MVIDVAPVTVKYKVTRVFAGTEVLDVVKLAIVGDPAASTKKDCDCCMAEE